jgi:hypothetical protein
MKHLLLCAAAGVCFGSPALANDDMSRPFGMASGGYEDPFYAPSRDDDGVRVVVNGRAVDLQQRSGYTSYQPMRRGVSGGATLRGPTLTANAIGNAISVSNTSNSTIFVNAINSGHQIAFARSGAGSAR